MQTSQSFIWFKQALRSWFQKLSTTLQTFGFHSIKSDSSLFVQFHSSYTIFILIYVDDIIITGSSLQEVQNLISKLSSCFALKDLGPLHYFLGVQVNCLSNGGLHLSQHKYINDLLIRTNMHAAKPLPTPMQTNLCIPKDVFSTLHDQLSEPFNISSSHVQNCPMQ